LAVATDGTPRLEPGQPLLAIAPRELLLTALKPADDDEGFVVRVLNPTNEEITGTIAIRVPFAKAWSTRLDETPDDGAVSVSGRTVTVTVPGHGLRTVHIA
ncbi:MAG: glycosyl hydrolase-related protein, partial [Actinomycetota bacterium]